MNKIVLKSSMFLESLVELKKFQSCLVHVFENESQRRKLDPLIEECHATSLEDRVIVPNATLKDPKQETTAV
jgi:hypothetical protein